MSKRIWMSFVKYMLSLITSRYCNALGKFTMRKILLVALLAFTYGSNSFAASEGDTYGGIQYSQVTYEVDDIDDLEPTALVGRYGQFIGENVAVEGRIGFGLRDDSVDVLGADFDLEVDTLLGIYYLFHAPGNSDTSVYGVLGFTRGRISVSLLDESESGSDGSLSYGVGVNIQSFNIEYMLYLDEDDYEVSAISLGYIYRF
ncbi:MAG: porin family protein [Gammaproteobacteria bacterium]|nr:porin family protein [Gammaproteobacteria bacterium]